MLRKTILLSLALPLAFLVGCEASSSDDTTATTDALESCFSTADGSTRCAIQSAGSSFTRQDRDVDDDGHPDRFVCAHVVHRGERPDGAGGSGHPSVHAAGGAEHRPELGKGGAVGGGRPAGGGSGGTTGKQPPLSVPADADCEHLGCVDMRSQGARGGSSGQNGPAGAGGASARQADDMRCPSPVATGGSTGNNAPGNSAP